MKIKALLSLLFVSLLFTNCKKEKSIDDLEVVNQEVVENFFKVTVSVIVKKDDDFSLFYTEDGTIDFKSEPIWKGVKGQDEVQKIVFNLPEEVYPLQLRLDFGLAKEQEDIVFKAITFDYKGKNKEISGVELGNYFVADQSKCTFDASTGIIKAVVKGGQRQYPSLYPQELTLRPLLENFGIQK